jgi:oligoribonuclease
MNLIFIDLETSGLDPATGEILEIGMLAVDPRTMRELAAWSTPLKAKCFTGEWHPKVVEMHTASGLLAELRSGPQNLKLAAGGFPDVREAEAHAVGFFNGNRGRTDPGWSPLCGANPDFDRRWLERHMPALARCFHYRSFDSNFCWQLRQFVTGGGQEKVGVAHRALADCRQSIQTIREFLGG